MKNISESKYIITIDRGNTKTSYALHELKSPVSKMISIDEAYLFHEEALIVASNVSSEEEYGLAIDINILDFFKENNFLSMPVHYTKTLGADRLSFAYLVWSYLSDKSDAKVSKKALAIDVGTFLTIDLISKQDGFVGGYIFPGPFTLMESYTAGAKLKNLPPDLTTPLAEEHIPRHTDDAISKAGGLMIRSTLESILKAYSDVDEIYLTGGGFHLISDLLPKEKTRENKMFLHRALYLIGKTILNSNLKS